MYEIPITVLLLHATQGFLAPLFNSIPHQNLIFCAFGYSLLPQMRMPILCKPEKAAFLMILLFVIVPLASSVVDVGYSAGIIVWPALMLLPIACIFKKRGSIQFLIYWLIISTFYFVNLFSASESILGAFMLILLKSARLFTRLHALNLMLVAIMMSMPVFGIFESKMGSQVGRVLYSGSSGIGWISVVDVRKYDARILFVDHSMIGGKYNNGDCIFEMFYFPEILLNSKDIGRALFL